MLFEEKNIQIPKKGQKAKSREMDYNIALFTYSINSLVGLIVYTESHS